MRQAPLSHRLGRRIEEYALLARFDRPVGTWLLLWPALWALWIAGNGHPDQQVFVIFVLGVIVMRAAGCAINDFVDRDIDPHIKRTRDRPVAARRVSPVEALAIFALFVGLAFALVLFLDLRTIELAGIGAALTISYPFVKRVFPLPQLYLGLSFGGWSVLMAFSAQAHALPRIAWVIYIATILWSVIYDTMYAMVDREDDLRVGVKSSAILFADLDRLMILVLQAMMLFALVLVGRTLHFTRWYFVGIAVAGTLFLYQQWLIRHRDPEACLKAFRNNQAVGMAIFAGILLQYLYSD